MPGGRAARFCPEPPLPPPPPRRGWVGSCSRAALRVPRAGADRAARPSPWGSGAGRAAGCPRRPARGGPRGLKRPSRWVRGAAPKFKPPPASPCCAGALGAVAILAARAVGRARRGAAGCCGSPGAALLSGGSSPAAGAGASLWEAGKSLARWLRPCKGLELRGVVNASPLLAVRVSPAPCPGADTLPVPPPTRSWFISVNRQKTFNLLSRLQVFFSKAALSPAAGFTESGENEFDKRSG